MAGKICAGEPLNNAGNAMLGRSFCEGLQYRAGGTAAERPADDCPHEIFSEAWNTWINGWTVADDAAGGAIDPASAPCCAVSSDSVPA